MQQYKAQFNQNGKLVASLIGPPLLIIPFIAALAKYFPNLSENTILALIFLFMGALIASVLYLVKLNLSNAVVTINQNELQLKFENRSRFTPADFNLPFSQINNCYLGANRAGFYLSISAAKTPDSFNLGAVSAKKEDVDDFNRLVVDLMTAVQAHNAQYGDRIKASNPSGPLLIRVLVFMVVITAAAIAVASVFL